MFKNLCDRHLPASYKNKIVYNFSKNLYSLNKLPFENEVNFLKKRKKTEIYLNLKNVKNFRSVIKWLLKTQLMY